MKVIIVLLSVLCLGSAVLCHTIKYVLETGSGFETQQGILTIFLNSTSGTGTSVDMMPEGDDITPITEYMVHETESQLRISDITAASVKWTARRADTMAGDSGASITLARVRVSPYPPPPSSQRDSSSDSVRSYCLSGRLEAGRLYAMTPC